MAKWEYKTVDFEDFSEEKQEELLNALGQEGWELVAVGTYSNSGTDIVAEWFTTTAYLKREIA